MKGPGQQVAKPIVPQDELGEVLSSAISTGYTSFVVSAEEQATLLDLTHDAILVLERETSVILYWNRGAELLYGWSKQEALGQVSHTLLKTVFPEPLADIEARVAREGRWEGELIHTRRDGQRVVVESRWAVRIDGLGQPVAHLEINIDITQRKQTEHALWVQAEVSRRFAEAQFDYPVLLEQAVRFISEITGNMCAIRLLSEDGTLLVPVAAHAVDPAKQEASRDAWHIRVYANHGIWAPVVHERRAIRIDGLSGVLPEGLSPEQIEFIHKHHPNSILVVPLIARGAFLGTLSLIRFAPTRPFDASDESLIRDLAMRAALAIDNARLYRDVEAARQRAAEALALLDTLIATAPVGIAFLDLELRYVRINKWLADLNHRPVEEHSGRTVREMVPFRADELERLLKGVLDTNEPVLNFELSGRGTTAEEKAHCFRISCFPVRCEAGALLGVGAIVEDVTEEARAKAERARMFEVEARARVEAEASNRAKDEFLSILSHELRTPLTAILGWSHILRDKRHDPEILGRGLETIERNAKTQAQIIEDILDVSRIITGKLRIDLNTVDLISIVKAAAETLRPSAEARGIELSLTLDPGPITLEGDAARLQQVAWNLLSNAIKFTPRGGRVEVGVSRKGRSAELCVLDSGVGITADFLPHVFERFKQEDTSAKRAFGGLGLGLSIVKYLVEQHGGAVRAESAGLGQGALFTVSLPCALEESVPSAYTDAAAPRPEPARLTGLRVLVVDDEADARELVDTVLSEHGAVVTLAASAKEALALLEREAFDALVSDIGMPGEDGYLLMERAKALFARQSRAIPALALTAYASNDDARRALGAGFTMHLPKPITPTRLVEAVAGLVAGLVVDDSRRPLTSA